MSSRLGAVTEFWLAQAVFFQMLLASPETGFTCPAKPQTLPMTHASNI
jgi:hypothetical protein